MIFVPRGLQQPLDQTAAWFDPLIRGNDNFDSIFTSIDAIDHVAEHLPRAKRGRRKKARILTMMESQTGAGSLRWVKLADNDVSITLTEICWQSNQKQDEELLQNIE